MSRPFARIGSKPAMPASGARVSRLALVKVSMARYISPILVNSVLGKAMESRGIQAAYGLPDGAIEAVVEESMLGLRLFVDPHRLPDLMLELAEILQREDG
jgi:hypothetical protein